MLYKNKIKVIAEIGVNHNGNMNLAKKLVRKAKDSGADYAKFQMYIPEEIVTKNCQTAKHQKNKKNLSQFKILKKYYLDQKKLNIIRKYCSKIKIKFLASVFDLKSLNILKKFNTDFIKLPSSEIDNIFLLKELSRMDKDVLFSTGMSSFNEIKYAFNFLNKNFKKKIIPMYCVSSYPTNIEEFDFSIIQKLKNTFKIFGFSDHSVTNEPSIICSYLGASFIERHLTLNKKMTGPDHSSSLNPEEFKKFVNSIRNVEKLKKIKRKNNELINKKFVRKFLVARNNIKKGQKFSDKNLTSKRSNGNLPSKFFFKLQGKKAKRNFNKDASIKL